MLKGRIEEEYATEIWCLRNLDPYIFNPGSNRDVAAFQWLGISTEFPKRALLTRLYLATPDERIQIRVNLIRERQELQRLKDLPPF